jgi:hypothetical protein
VRVDCAEDGYHTARPAWAAKASEPGWIVQASSPRAPWPWAEYQPTTVHMFFISKIVYSFQYSINLFKLLKIIEIYRNLIKCKFSFVGLFVSRSIDQLDY